LDYTDAMQLYVVRHAYAGQHGDPLYPDDSLRPLTKEGRKRFKATVKRLAKRGFHPEIIATSPLVRCRQTADLVAELVPCSPEVVELAELAPDSKLDSLLTWTNQRVEASIAWVGHAPDVDRMVGTLIGQQAAIRMAKGGVAYIDFEDAAAVGQGTLKWFVIPKILGL